MIKNSKHSLIYLVAGLSFIILLVAAVCFYINNRYQRCIEVDELMAKSLVHNMQRSELAVGSQKYIQISRKIYDMSEKAIKLLGSDIVDCRPYLYKGEILANFDDFSGAKANLLTAHNLLENPLLRWGTFGPGFFDFQKKSYPMRYNAGTPQDQNRLPGSWKKMGIGKRNYS